MKKMLKWLCATVLTVITVGCCIDSRRIAFDREPDRLQSGYYHYYTNGLTEVVGFYSYPVKPIYKVCSYTGGPWRGSDIYPATRNVLNHASFMSYSSAASGDYMLNIINLPFYPVILIEIPIQFCLDTILIPWDLLNAPSTPEGYSKQF